MAWLYWANLHFMRPLVCPGDLLQSGSTIYRLRRRQGQIFVAGAVFGGRPQNGLGWLAGLAGLTQGPAIACRNLPRPSAAARRLWGRSPQRGFHNLAVKLRRSNQRPNRLSSTAAAAVRRLVVSKAPILFKRSSLHRLPQTARPSAQHPKKRTPHQIDGAAMSRRAQ